MVADCGSDCMTTYITTETTCGRKERNKRKEKKMRMKVKSNQINTKKWRNVSRIYRTNLTM